MIIGGEDFVGIDLGDYVEVSHVFNAHHLLNVRHKFYQRRDGVDTERPYRVTVDRGSVYALEWGKMGLWNCLAYDRSGDRPAVIFSFGRREGYMDGKLHRSLGRPAKISEDGPEWYEYGKKYSSGREAEWLLVRGSRKAIRRNLWRFKDYDSQKALISRDPSLVNLFSLEGDDYSDVKIDSRIREEYAELISLGGMGL